MSTALPAEQIETAILPLRDHGITLDRDLAAMYGVSTRDLSRTVSGNLDGLPEDRLLQRTRPEFNDLPFQSGRFSWGGARKLPGAFAERGIAMRRLMAPPERKSRPIGCKP